ncbi:hypothetical protein G6F61_006160 [Rhizopus arrhizus]|nr:hypothetical protein G6F61_006160 [Rhizopus arrhizus]
MAEVRRDNITNEHWYNYLKIQGVIVSEIEKQTRHKVVDMLRNIMVRFQNAVAKNMYWKREDFECILSPFGSFGLGGYIKSDVVELALVCPYQIHRSDFFKFFPELLKEQHLINNIESIKKATVPIIKCVIDKISVNISFIRLKLERITHRINFLDNSLLQDMDNASLAAMDGPRLNQFNKRQIKPSNVRLFQVSLQCIKYWAIQRGLYNAEIGYLNETACTLLLIKSFMFIQSKENLSIIIILQNFFQMWSKWPWKTPVILTDHITDKNGNKLEYNSITGSQEAMMPIISPCYPVYNVTPYVTKLTQKTIQLEFERGNTVLEAEAPPLVTINKLFNSINYLSRYKHFISIVTSSCILTSHDIWSHNMASYIPKYIELIEKNTNIVMIQPMMNPYKVQIQYLTSQERINLQNGLSPQRARVRDKTDISNTGILYLTYYTICIQIQEQCKELDLTESTKSFLTLLEIHNNKKEIATLLKMKE